MSRSSILHLQIRALLLTPICAAATSLRRLLPNRPATTRGRACLLLALVAIANTGTLRAQTFSAPNSYHTNRNPSDGVVRDFNGDGKLDLAVTISQNNTVAILIGRGDGTFQNPVYYATDFGTPDRIVSDDLNGDGKFDLVIGNVFGGSLSTGSLTILLGNGDGTFQSHVGHDMDVSKPGGLALADLNGDGKLDLVAASYSGNLISVLLGNGSGGFASPVTYTAGTTGEQLHSVALADFNGDTKLDVAVTSNLSGATSILLGNGNGTFQSPSTFSTGQYPAGIIATDLNGDAKQDLVIAVANSNAMFVLLGNGNGTFQTAVTYSVEAGPQFFRLSDLNGDGKVDTVVVNSNANTLSILRGNGNGTFQPAVTTPVRFGSVNPLTADFDSDGKPDLAIIDNAVDFVDVRLNSPSPHTVNINAIAGTPATVMVATFVDYDETKPASSFTAAINWGDGSGPTAGTVAANGPKNFNVTGTHTYTLPGPYAVNIQIADDSSNFANVTSPATVKGSTSTAVSSNANPSDFGQSVTFTATVTSGAGTPSATVQFKDNGSSLATPQTLNGSGVATFTTSTLTTGTHTITADYGGNANFLLSSGTLAGGQLVKTPPSLSINDISVTEGDSATKTLTFTVTLSAASNLTVTTNFATANLTASAGIDYVAISTTPLTFNPGVTTRTIGVTINGDTNFEPNESFTGNLSTPVNATIGGSQGTGTILNDDAEGGFISFSQADYSLSESTGQVTITVNRTNDTSAAATVDYATDDTGASASCGTSNGTASARCDFTTAMGTMKFAPGETLKTFAVLVNRDSYVEGAELFKVNLSNLTGGALFITPSSANVTIIDSPAGTPPNAIDDASNFVRQNYHDFLNREPDASGLGFWTNEITLCGSDQACIDVKRINVSAAFFLSIEFQGTGYLVERLYKTSYGDVSATSTFGGAHQLLVPVVRFSEFLPDTQEIGQGVVVGQPGWEAALESKKQTFVTAFVQRARFVTALPISKTPSQFVDQLNTNAGNVLSASERATAIGLFGSATDSSDLTARAQALRQVAEDPDFNSAEFNRAFVLMQYFGYLRRNPNDPQDMDYSGYEFWLSKLNQFNGNFASADMVKAFITSGEYRLHFGP